MIHEFISCKENKKKYLPYNADFVYAFHEPSLKSFVDS